MCLHMAMYMPNYVAMSMSRCREERTKTYSQPHQLSSVSRLGITRVHLPMHTRGSRNTPLSTRPVTASVQTGTPTTPFGICVNQTRQATAQAGTTATTPACPSPTHLGRLLPTCAHSQHTQGASISAKPDQIMLGRWRAAASTAWTRPSPAQGCSASALTPHNLHMKTRTGDKIE
jgi:hypothetical protein